MPGNSVAVHEVRWAELLPGLLLFRAVRTAAEVPKLLLATLGLLLSWGGWVLASRTFASLPAGGPSDSPIQHWLTSLGSLESGRVDVVIFGPGNVLEVPARLAEPVLGIFDGQTDLATLGLLLLCGVWSVAVWSLMGGAITRIAAVQLGRGERVGLKQALRFAWRKWSAYFGAPLMPLVVAGAIVVLLAPVGLILRLPGVGSWIAAALWPIVLLFALCLTILAVGLLFGWPLMWAAVSAEGGDSFTALSNAYAYVYQRAWHYLGYGVAACIIGAVGWTAFRLFAGLLLYLAAWAVGWSSGTAAADWDRYARQLSPPLELSVADTIRESAGGAESTEGAVNRFHGFWQAAAAWVVAGYGVSYFWTASTGIYLLLRLSLDGTELDAVFLEDDQPRTGLPPLAADERGVPVKLTDEEPQASGPESRGTSPA